MEASLLPLLGLLNVWRGFQGPVLSGKRGNRQKVREKSQMVLPQTLGGEAVNMDWPPAVCLP